MGGAAAGLYTAGVLPGVVGRVMVLGLVIVAVFMGVAPRYASATGD